MTTEKEPSDWPYWRHPMPGFARPVLPRRLIVECDYGADAVWGETRDGERWGVELDPLPASAEVKMDLLAWAKRFDQITWPPDAERPIDPEAWRGFVAEGRRIVERLQRELGDEIEVVLGHTEI